MQSNKKLSKEMISFYEWSEGKESCTTLETESVMSSKDLETVERKRWNYCCIFQFNIFNFLSFKIPLRKWKYLILITSSVIARIDFLRSERKLFFEKIYIHLRMCFQDIYERSSLVMNGTFCMKIRIFVYTFSW